MIQIDRHFPHIHCPTCEWGTNAAYQRPEGATRDHSDWTIRLACGHEFEVTTYSVDDARRIRALPPIPSPYVKGQPLRVKSSGDIILFTRERIRKTGVLVEGVHATTSANWKVEFRNVEPARPSYQELLQFVRDVDKFVDTEEGKLFVKLMMIRAEMAP